MANYMIFGKEDCPHTQKVVEDFKKQHRSFAFVNVDKDPQGLKKLLEYTADNFAWRFVDDSVLQAWLRSPLDFSKYWWPMMTCMMFNGELTNVESSTFFGSITSYEYRKPVRIVVVRRSPVLRKGGVALGLSRTPQQRGASCPKDHQQV